VIDEDHVRDEVRQIAANDLADEATVTVRRGATARLEAVLPATTSLGLRGLVPVTVDTNGARHTAADARISNEFFDVSYAKGRLDVTGWATGIELRNVAAFVSEGDRGDEYNADILPDGVIRPA